VLEAKSKVAVTLNAFPSIRTVFGRVIDARLSSGKPSLFIQRLAADRKLGLEFWEERCAGYLAAVADEGTAIEKATTELIGSAVKDCHETFDLRLDDYFLEICVVHDLAVRGYSGFEPLVVGTGPKPPKRPDYRFVIHDEQDQERSAYLEVKNLRAPIGINVIFQRLRGELSIENPHLKSLGIVVSHKWDNTVSEIQKSEIRTFLMSLSGVEPLSSRKLTLDGGIEINIQFVPRPGLTFLRRFTVNDSFGPFTKQDRLLNKATATIQKAIDQFRECPVAAPRVVAINVESPDSVVSSDTCVRMSRP